MRTPAIHRSASRSPSHSRPWARCGARRGATAVEVSLILLLFLTAIIGMFDLGIAVFRRHTLAEAARQGARQAIVHGSCADRLGPWGPATIGPAPLSTVAAEHEIGPIIQASLPNSNPDEVAVQVEWPDGNNDFEQTVRVDLSEPYRPIAGFIFGGVELQLHASSEMRIAH